MREGGSGRPETERVGVQPQPAPCAALSRGVEGARERGGGVKGAMGGRGMDTLDRREREQGRGGGQKKEAGVDGESDRRTV